MIDPLSLTDTIKHGEFSGSLLTSFNANFRYYEEFILRRLVSAGCRNNVLLVDGQQLVRACASGSTRPRRAGTDYVLVPIAVTGAFHPKLGLLAGKRQASLFVGSHNLTISGFGYNRELTNHLKFEGPDWKSRSNPFNQAWAGARNWISSMSEVLPHAVLESAYALDRVFGPGSDAAPVRDSVELLLQYPGTEGLLSQLAQVVQGEVHRITILGAFFDSKAELLQAMHVRWPKAEVVIGVEPETVWMMHAPDDPRSRIVNATGIGRGEGYLHAKAVYLQTAEGKNVFASGSANPSSPAWLSHLEYGNVEAMLVRVGMDADRCAEAIELPALWSFQPLTKAELQKIALRSEGEERAPCAAPPVLFGVAEQEEQVVRVRLPEHARQGHFLGFDEMDQPTINLTITVGGDDWLSVTGPVSALRSILVKRNDQIIIRIIVHHPYALQAHVRVEARPKTDVWLHQLSEEGADMSRVLGHLEKFIFSDEAVVDVGLPVGLQNRRSSEGQPEQRPATLEASVRYPLVTQQNSLFRSPCDLAALIRMLVNHVPLTKEHGDRGLDALGRSEEEQIGRDDDDEVLATSHSQLMTPQTCELCDHDVAEQVARAASKLVRRMSQSINGAADGRQTAVRIARLTAVLAILQELGHLSTSQRWQQGRLHLLPDSDVLWKLFEAATCSFLGPGDHDWAEYVSQGNPVPDELLSLASLMLWLAWWCEAEWSCPSASLHSYEESTDSVTVNARLFRLLCLASDDATTWQGAKRFAEQTLPHVPSQVRAASRWFERHRSIARKLTAIIAQGRASVSSTAIAGDVVTIPAVFRSPTIALGVTSNAVSIVGEGGIVRHFTADRVIVIGRAQELTGSYSDDRH